MIIWFEIPADDLTRAVGFYSSVLGKKIEVKNLMGVDHALIPSEKDYAGVIVKKERLTPGSGVLIFFKVDDISSVLHRVENKGGKILVPKTLLRLQNPDGSVIISHTLIDNQYGYYAVFADSEENHIGLYGNT